jgi:molybdopterin-biosynthesis enzyme MoeA-like protein
MTAPPKEKVASPDREATDNTDDILTTPDNPFPLECLPNCLIDLAVNVSDSTHTPVSLSVSAGLSMIGASLGKNLRVATYPGEHLCGNLYIVPIVASGVGKSRAAKAMLKPIYDLHDRKKQEWLDDVYPGAQAELEQIKMDIQECYQAMKKPEKITPGIPREPKERLKELFKEQREREQDLLQPHFYTTDATESKLATMLRDNNEVMASISTEAGPAVQGLVGKYNKLRGGGKEINTDDSLFLCGFSQDRYKPDRLTSECSDLIEPTINLFWMIQPRYIPTLYGNDSLVTGGFLPRCLAFNTRAEFEDITGNEPALPLKSEFYTKVNELFEAFLVPVIMPHVVTPTKEAREILRQHRNECGHMQNQEYKDIGQFVARWTEYVWKIALCLHAIEYGKQSARFSLQASTVRNAIKITDWYTREFLELIKMGREDMADAEAEKLQDYVLRKATFVTQGRKGVPLRDVLRNYNIKKDDLMSMVDNHPQIFAILDDEDDNGKPLKVLCTVPKFGKK